MPPFGDLGGTILSILATSEGRRIVIDYRCNGKELSIDTAEVTDILGGVPINHPKVVAFLKDYIAERLGGDDETRGSTQD